jgi:CubicO group peptidase (beta-lactamase class C family)
MPSENPMSAPIRSLVDAGELAGAAILVWRGGAVMHAEGVGWQDVAARLPIKRDTLFRIASMTKPITSATALTLYEEDRFQLDEPISHWAPEFVQMRVLRSPEGPLDQAVPAGRPITFEDLLTHRAGFTYGEFHSGPIGRAYAAALGGHIDSALSPDEWIAALAALPLIDQPGAAFHYGHSTDLLGLLIARMEGAPLGDVLARRMFEPLGMRDTAFTVEPAKRSRRAGLYGFDDAGRLKALQAVPGGHALPERPADMRFVSGGQGLWSTVDDFLAFARIFVEHGRAGGVRLLRPETVAMMSANQLTAPQRAISKMFGQPIFARGHGFGMGVAVVTDPAHADPLRCGGGTGAVGWPGAYGGWWQADPNDATVLIFLSHTMVELDQLANGIGLGAWDAITRFQALASLE